MVTSISTKLLSIPRIQEFEEDILGAFCDFNSIAGFNELLTHQHRRMFYREHLMLIPPEKCLLGSKYVQRIGGRGQKLVKKFGYFIPLIKLLHKLVKIPQVEHFILNDHVSHNEFMQDVCDGSYIKSHNLMIQGEIFLQFVISCDDLELQNPLRSNKTHKLGMFYFTL